MLQTLRASFLYKTQWKFCYFPPTPSGNRDRKNEQTNQPCTQQLLYGQFELLVKQSFNQKIQGFYYAHLGIHTYLGVYFRRI